MAGRATEKELKQIGIWDAALEHCYHRESGASQGYVCDYHEGYIDAWHAINDAVMLTTDHEAGFWEGWSAGQDVLRRDMMEILDLIEAHHIPEPEKHAKGDETKI
jgi:hypothetical protein